MEAIRKIPLWLWLSLMVFALAQAVIAERTESGLMAPESGAFVSCIVAA